MNEDGKEIGFLNEDGNVALYEQVGARHRLTGRFDRAPAAAALARARRGGPGRV